MRNISKMALLVGAATVIVVTPAAAQTGESGTGETATDAVDAGEIVVTAQKRSERLQDVPLAVTAVTGEALTARQINDTSGLVQAVPSLTFQQGANPVASSFRIRGVGTSLFGLGTESSVALVVDGVVSARQTQNFTDFADIERVEVLRGPQGTLFGKNATAGVISVVTARPSRELEGRASVTVAEMDEYRASGTISGPIGDTIGVRLTGYYNDIGGNIRNLLTGRDANRTKSWGVRGKLEWQPTDRLTLLFAGDYRESDSDCCQSVLVKVGNPLRALVSGPITARADNDEVWSNGTTGVKSDQQTYSLQADLDLGAATLTSITALQKYHLTQNVEVDSFGHARPIYISPASSAEFNLNYGLTDIKNFTQELRLASNGSGPFTYVIGGFYSKVSIDRYFSRRRALCLIGVVGQPCAAPVYQSLASDSDLSNESIAGFGQVELKLVGGLKAIGGLRVQYEKIAVDGERFGVLVPGDALYGGTPSVRAGTSASDTAVTGKAGLQYEFSRFAQAYGTYTRGYKGLGFNTEISADFGGQAPVLPEHVDAYEIGFKGRTTDGTFGIAVAAFLADYTNLQVQANRSDTLNGVPAFIQTNAGSSRTKGFEIEATFRPSRAFSLTAAVTYAHNSFDIDGLNCPQQFQPGAPVIAIGGTRPVNSCYRYQFRNNAGTLMTSGPVQDVKGGKLPASPQWRINLSPRYEQELSSNLAGFVQADLSFQSDQGFALEQDPLLQQDGFAIVDLSLGVRQPERGFGLTLYVKNLFDQNYYSGMTAGVLVPANPTLVDSFANRPRNADRYVGATLDYRF
ncbi:TonB-dependent receptor [Sphingopyxis sp. LARHCG72]